MPLYNYKCSLCEETHDVVKSFKEFDREEHCPKCNTEMTRQVVQTAPPIFKGSGFYQTDYKDKGK